MNEQTCKSDMLEAPQGFENGFRIEHILLSVTVVHTNKIMQYDDTCAHLIVLGLAGYKGVLRSNVEVHYKHGKTENHPDHCECGICRPAAQKDCPTSPGPTKPPLGIQPCQIHREKRMHEIACAVARYARVKKEIPQEWLNEFESLTSFINPESI